MKLKIGVAILLGFLILPELTLGAMFLISGFGTFLLLKNWTIISYFKTIYPRVHPQTDDRLIYAPYRMRGVSTQRFVHEMEHYLGDCTCTMIDHRHIEDLTRETTQWASVAVASLCLSIVFMDDPLWTGLLAGAAIFGGGLLLGSSSIIRAELYLWRKDSDELLRREKQIQGFRENIGTQTN